MRFIMLTSIDLWQINSCVIIIIVMHFCVLARLIMKHRQPTAKKGSWNPENMIRAVEDIMKNSMTERKAAEIYNVKRSTLKRRLKDARNAPACPGASLSVSVPYSTSSMKIFTIAEETAS